MRATLIGYGEAGQAFDLAGNWLAYDVLANRSKVAGFAEAMAGAEIILSVVTADQALAAAQAAAALIAHGALYCDMNSVAPGTKQQAAAAIEAAGGRYVDVAVMSPVNPSRLDTPLLVSGPHSEEAMLELAGVGFTQIRSAGDSVGRASTIKMLRSVMYKGVEALTAECLIACEKAGVTEDVLGSFSSGTGSGDWASGADYRLDRMLVHGLRRSAEMREASETLRGLGVVPLMTDKTANWQQTLGELGISPVPEGLDGKLRAILDKMP